MKLNNNQYKYLLCDSIAAYNYIKNKVKYKYLITSSPAILNNKNISCTSIYKGWSYNKIKQFQENIFLHNLEIYKKINSIKNINKEENIVINLAVSNFQKKLLRFGLISFVRKKDSTLFIKHITNNKKHNFINPPWDEIFSQNKNFKTIKFRDEFNYKSNKVQKVNIIQRVFFAGYETFKIRLYKKLFSIINYFNQKYLIILSENELSIEIASRYLSKGYEIKDFSKYKKKFVKLTAKDKTKITKIFKKIEPIITKRINKWVSNEYSKLVLKNFKCFLYQNLEDYYSWHYTYKEILKTSFFTKENTILFCNSASNNKVQAAKNIFNNKKIPLISFQHGVTAEISASHLYNRIHHNTSVSDIFIAFNDNSAEIAKKNPFANCNSISFRGPKRFERVKTNLNKRVKNSILFLSNNLYRGNYGSLGNWATDEQMAETELTIISIINKTRRQIYYKPYPETYMRYIDEDPVLSYVNKCKQINVITNKIDARYILSSYDILICGTSTSTLSWALMSEKPLIFINYKYLAPMQKDALKLLEKSIFVVNYNSKYFKKKITNILKSNKRELYQEWNKKKIYRKKFISEFISNSSNNYKSLDINNLKIN